MARRGIGAALAAVLLAGLLTTVPAAASPLPPWPPPPPAAPAASGLPPGVAPAALRPEATLPAPPAWPFSEAFPRTSGTGRIVRGALLWTDFLYDDNGAASGPGLGESAGAWPYGTYRYPDPKAAGNGADIFRAGIGLDANGDTYWRVDWNTLTDARIPAAAFGIQADYAGVSPEPWGGNVGVSSTNVDHTLVITAAGAFFDGRRVAPTAVDVASGSFVVRLPGRLFEASDRMKVWLASGLANETGDAFRSLGPEHQHLPGQPNVFNVAFRDYTDEPADKNFWFERTQATTLAAPNADVTRFARIVDWNRLAAGITQREPRPTGWSNRWYVSRIELGPGRVKALQSNVDGKPNYLGRVQPYGVYVPSGGGRAPRPLTWLLHSLTINHNQYGATMPDLLRLACEQRDSICATPLGRGPDGNYRAEAELDFWEVWRSLNRTYRLDPDRTIIGGYSMGGFGAFNLALDHPDIFAGMVILASAANEDLQRLENARWLPYYHAHGMLDELVPYHDEARPTIAELDRLGYRYVFDTYPTKDHIAWSLEDGNDEAGHWMAGPVSRRVSTGDITYRWYPREANATWGIGPTGAWWVRGLRAADVRESSARVRAVSHALPERRVRSQRSSYQFLDDNASVVSRERLTWALGRRPQPKGSASVRLENVRRVRLALAEAGLAKYFLSTITVVTDRRVEVVLRQVPRGAIVRVDGARTDYSPVLRPGRHRITVVMNPPMMPIGPTPCGGDVCLFGGTQG